MPVHSLQSRYYLLSSLHYSMREQKGTPLLLQLLSITSNLLTLRNKKIYYLLRILETSYIFAVENKKKWNKSYLNFIC